MTAPEPVATKGRRSLWDLLSDFSELRDRPLPEFCTLICRQLIDSGVASAAGIWLVTAPDDKVLLLSHQGIDTSVALTEPQLRTMHERWLSSVLKRGEPPLWCPPVEPEDRAFRALAVPLKRQERVVGALELIQSPISPEDDFMATHEFLTELARLVTEKLESAARAAPMASPAAVATEPVVKPTQANAPMNRAGSTSTIVEPPAPRVVPTPPPVANGRPQPVMNAPATVVAEPQQPRVQVQQPAAPTRLPVPPMPAFTPDTAGPGLSSDLWKSLVALSVDLQRSLSVRDVAAAAANDGRKWLGCDRVTVLVKRGTRWRVRGISGTAQVNRRSPVPQKLERLVSYVGRGANPVQHPDAQQGVAPELEGPLSDFIKESGSRWIRLVPLVKPDDRPREDDQAKTERPFACLVVEQFAEGAAETTLPQRIEQLADCVTRPLANALSYESVWLLPLWQRLGAAWNWLRAGRMASALALLLLIAGISTAMVLVPWEYRVEATGMLLPSDRREVFAPQDGHVLKVLVNSGDPVAADQVLLLMQNKELDAELVTASTQFAEKQQLARALRVQADEASKNGRRDEELQLFGQAEEARVQAEGLARQVNILKERVEQLTVKAPIAGRVATFQVDQLLKHRPVQRGEVLLSVMNENGPWQLELETGESRLGHLVAAQQRNAKERLPIEFVLVTRPENHHAGLLRNVATRATMARDDKLVVKLIADFDANLGDQQRIGAEVRARIACGKKPVGYVMFGDVIEFVQRYVWW